MRRATRGERVLGAGLVGIGVFALYQATGLPLGNLREPDAGFFPVVVAVTLTLFAAFALNSRAYETDHPHAERGGIARVLIVSASLGAYAWLLPSVGFVLCTAVLLGVLLRGVGEVSWRSTVIGASGGAAGCYFLFTRLGMPLPPGLLGF